MVFQKWLSILLSGAILSTPFHFAIPQEANDSFPELRLEALESRPLLRQFNQLKKEAQVLLQVAEAEKGIEAFYVLKNFTEKVLNAPLLSWDGVSLEFTISQLEDALIKDVKGFEPISNEERIFLDWDLTNSDLPTLIEKETLFLGFEDIRKEFDKTNMVFHWKVALPSYLKINVQGKKDFERFVSEPRYTLMQEEGSSGTYEIIPKLSDLQTLELEALAQDQSESGWKNILKRVAIDLSVAEWVSLDALWISSLHPPAQRLSLLPLSCQGQYQTLHPLTIPHLLEEKEKVASRALFEAQFYTMLRVDESFQIPIFVSEPLVQKLLEVVPLWREEAQAQAQRMFHLMQNLENQFTTYALSWYFQSQDDFPFVWRGSREDIELKILKQVVETKKILLLAIVERILWESKAPINSEIKTQIIALTEEASHLFQEDAALKSVSHRIYEIYQESQITLEEVKKDLSRKANPKTFVEDQLQIYMELTQKIIDQDQKIAQRKEGFILPPLEDTPENFKTASLAFASELTESLSQESFDEIEKVLFEEESTYEAAFDRYHEWLLAFQGEEKIKGDVKKIASVMGLEQTRHLFEVFKDSEKRILFEQAVRGLLITQEPLLETEIEYEGHSQPFYVHLGEAVKQKKPDSVLIELIQRAVWAKKKLVEYEVDRFCRLDPHSPQGLEFLLANTVFRKAGLLKFHGFENLNEKVMEELHQELSEGKFEQAIGYGFLTVIGLSFASGPLRRLPWWLGGRLAKVIPHSLLKGGHVFGMAAAPLAIWWMGEHTKRYFWQEEDVVGSLENWSAFHIQGREADAVTVLDLLREEAHSKDSSNSSRHHPDIVKNKLELRMAQVSFVLFAPVHYAFIRGMLAQGYQFYSQKLPFTRRVGVSAALKKLYVPTRFWTFRAGNELLALPPEALKRAYLDAVDRSISVPKLTSYIEQWTKLLTRELAEHEAKWGVGATWQETVQMIEARAAKSWVPRHVNRTLERQMLMVRVRLNQEALVALRKQGTKKVSELSLRQRFVPAIEELEMYFDQNLASFYPQDELAWLMSNVDTSRFVGLWFGGWVGVRGSLGHALDKMAAYQYLSSQRLPLLFSILR